MLASASHLNSKQASRPPIVNAMTVDVEDYFQVQALTAHFPKSLWDTQSARVERNTDRVLSLFADFGVKATFFTLGWVAERYKSLILRIRKEGHELASHGYDHTRADQQDYKAFRDDIRRSKQILEDASGARVRGYRAATFSIGRGNLWAFEVLGDEGYVYSSSIYPIRHDNYGMPEAPRFPFRPLANSNFVEVPISTLRLASRNFPCGGGGYFRLLPYVCSKWSISLLNLHEDRPSVFYLHPWELDPDQPRPRGLSGKTRVRHYLNLNRTERRLARLLEDFRWGRMDDLFVDSGRSIPHHALSN
jgi:polysaccharide deacetylase family protein (PEP-CTERM system associated)